MGFFFVNIFKWDTLKARFGPKTCCRFRSSYSIYHQMDVFTVKAFCSPLCVVLGICGIVQSGYP